MNNTTTQNSVSDGNYWKILTFRYGFDIRNPSKEDLERAATELFQETLPEMTEDDYKDHPAAWLRYGLDDGPMFVLEVHRSGTVILERWADTDYVRELYPPKQWSVHNATDVVRLWQMLGEGKISELEREGAVLR
jgi:hypothetical protein